MAAATQKPCSLHDSLFKIANGIAPMATRAINDLIGNRYLSLNQILLELRPLLEKEGVLLMQLPSVKERSLEVTTVLIKGEERLEHVCAMPVVDPSPQGVGSLITYARRYTLSALFCLTTEDDDCANTRSASSKPDSAQPKSTEETTGQPSPMPKPRIEELEAAIKVATAAQLKHLKTRLPSIFDGADLQQLQASIETRLQELNPPE